MNSALDELNRDSETAGCEFLCVRHKNKLALDLPLLQIDRDLEIAICDLKQADCARIKKSGFVEPV